MSRFSRIVGLVLLVGFFESPISLRAQSHPGRGTASGGAHVPPSRPPSSIAGRQVAPFSNPPVTGSGHNPEPPYRHRRRPDVAGPVFIPTYGLYPYNYYNPIPGPVSIAPDPITEQQGYAQAPVDVPAVNGSMPAVNQLEAHPSDADLSYEVGRLAKEVEDLRQQQAAVQAAPPLQSSQPEAVIPVVLIFHDGHRREIQNYAVIGQMLWVLDEKSSTKIALSDLDLEATQRENQARGVRFSIPSK